MTAQVGQPVRMAELVATLSLVADLGHGLMTYSRLGFGLYTGRYVDGVPPESRAGVAGQVGDWLVDVLRSPDLNARVRRLRELAGDVPVARFALAWCLRNPAVHVVIPGCKDVKQVESNASAAELAK